MLPRRFEDVLDLALLAHIRRRRSCTVGALVAWIAGTPRPQVHCLGSLRLELDRSTVTLLTVVHELSHYSDLGRIDPSFFIVVYLLLCSGAAVGTLEAGCWLVRMKVVEAGSDER
jgi:hypothetical protein